MLSDSTGAIYMAYRDMVPAITNNHVYKLDSNLNVLIGKYVTFGDNVGVSNTYLHCSLGMDEANGVLYSIWTGLDQIYICKQSLSTLVASFCTK